MDTMTRWSGWMQRGFSHVVISLCLGGTSQGFPCAFSTSFPSRLHLAVVINAGDPPAEMYLATQGNRPLPRIGFRFSSTAPYSFLPAFLSPCLSRPPAQCALPGSIRCAIPSLPPVMAGSRPAARVPCSRSRPIGPNCRPRTRGRSPVPIACSPGLRASWHIQSACSSHVTSPLGVTLELHVTDGPACAVGAELLG